MDIEYPDSRNHNPSTVAVLGVQKMTRIRTSAAVECGGLENRHGLVGD